MFHCSISSKSSIHTPVVTSPRPPAPTTPNDATAGVHGRRRWRFKDVGPTLVTWSRSKHGIFIRVEDGGSEIPHGQPPALDVSVKNLVVKNEIYIEIFSISDMEISAKKTVRLLFVKPFRKPWGKIQDSFGITPLGHT